MSAGVEPDDALNPSEVRRRASGAVVLLMGRGAALRLIGFGSTLVVARLLAPRDFGLVALAMTIVGVGQVIADSGLGSGLVQRAEPPSRRELSALVGFQLLITSAIAAIAAAVALATSGADGVLPRRRPAATAHPVAR